MDARMLFSVTPGDTRPIYRQIVGQVKTGIAAGLLLPGDRLPSHRQLAREVVVAPLTVKHAYDVLESEGLLETRRGLGTFVTAAPARVTREASADLDLRIEAIVQEARVLGLDETELRRRLERAWRGTKRRRARRG